MSGTEKTPVREYVSADDNFTVPSNNDVSFNGIVFEVSDGAPVILDTEAKIQVKGARRT